MSVTLPSNVALAPSAPIGVTMRVAGPAAVTLVQGGPRGPQGPQGASGAGAASMVFTFATSSHWVCPHNLGRLPVSIVVYDDAGNVRPLVPIANPSLDTTVLSPTPALAGSVVII